MDDLDDLNFDDEPEETLEQAVGYLSAGFGLTPDEQAALLLIGQWHDDAQATLADAIEEALRRDPSDINLEYFRSQQPVIAEKVRAQAAPHRAEVALLERPQLAEAVVALCLGGDESGASPIGLRLLADALEPVAPHQTKVALEYLRGRVADRMGVGLDAEAAFEKAVGLNPTWGPALEWLATMAGDRGDAARALSLLDRAGISPDDGQYQMLEAYRPSNVVTLRRNDPCWCGSGRKLKACHREGETLPLGARAVWLFQKAARFVQDGPFRSEMLDLASERARYGGEREVLDALTDPLVISAMMFEGLALDMFAETRGPLLPADELDLLREWLGIRRGLYEVEEVVVDDGLHVRNVLDGECLFVREVLGSRGAHVGMLFVSVVLPRGDGSYGFFGGIEPVSLLQREGVIRLLDSDPEPIELVAAMTDRLAPTELVTTQGDPLEECTTVISVQGRRSLPRALDGQFSRVGDSEWLAGLDGGPIAVGATIGGQLEVDGRLVTITTMSRSRMDLLLDVIEDLGLPFTVVSETSVSLAELAASPARPDAAPPPLDSPELQALLAQHIARYEREWLDMDIPALGGLTPRQAAADPIARRDLIALINSFPTGVPNTMDADRLRAELGLDE